MRSLAALTLAAVALVVTPAAPLSDTPVDALPVATDAQLEASVQPLDPSVTGLERSVTEVAATTTEGSEEVITLASGILFGFDQSSLGARARARIRTLVADVPKDARVAVGGHTDSVGSERYNEQLSTARAKAVAAVVRRARPDLRLDVEGFGETRPVAPNTSGGEDDPQGRAKNRRVEIRYGG